MKRKHFLSVAVMLASVVLGGSLASCSGDDDSYIPSPTVTDKDGNKVQVTSVGNIRFSYDENGKLTSMSDSYDTYTLDGDKFAFDADEGHAEVYLNSDGFITKIEVNESEGNRKNSVTVEYSYSDHRLKSCSASGKESNGSEYWKGTAKVNYTWKNGNLVQVAIDSKEEVKEDGETYTETDKMNYVFTYGTQVNHSKQLPFYMGDEITGAEEFGAVFSVIGLFGYGPAYLPVGYTMSETDERDRSYALSFTQNNNGTINTESLDGHGIVRYGYNYNQSRAEGVGTQSIKQYVSSLSNLFKHRRQ